MEVLLRHEDGQFHALKKAGHPTMEVLLLRPTFFGERPRDGPLIVMLLAC